VEREETHGEESYSVERRNFVEKGSVQPFPWSGEKRKIDKKEALLFRENIEAMGGVFLREKMTRMAPVFSRKPRVT
jgi:hypothetical protein